MMVATVPQTHWGFLRGQNRHMKEAGFELHIMSSPGPLLDRVRERDQVEVHPIPITRTIQPWHDLLVIWQMWRIFRRVRPHIVHLSTPKAALIGSIAAALAGVPTRIYLVRGSITDNATGWKRWFYRNAEALTARLCHEVIAVSPSLLGFLRGEGIIPATRGRVIGSGMSNGVDVNWYDPDEPSLKTQIAARDSEHPVIGFVGRLNLEKGVDDLLDAWLRLRERFPNLRLLIVGNWDTSNPSLASIRATLEADPRVEFVGFVTDVRPHYCRMSVFLFPSRREGFPNAPMEAAAMRIPVVGTRAVGVVDAVVDGETGRLYEIGDSPTLTQAVTEYLEDPALRQAHGNAARERVLREFRPLRIWQEMAALYRECLSRQGMTLQPPASPESVCESARRAA